MSVVAAGCSYSFKGCEMTGEAGYELSYSLWVKKYQQNLSV